MHFEELDLLTTSDTLCGIKNTDRVLSIRKVILESKRFMVVSSFYAKFVHLTSHKKVVV